MNDFDSLNNFQMWIKTEPLDLDESKFTTLELYPLKGAAQYKQSHAVVVKISCSFVQKTDWDK